MTGQASQDVVVEKKTVLLTILCRAHVPERALSFLISLSAMSMAPAQVDAQMPRPLRPQSASLFSPLCSVWNAPHRVTQRR